MPKFNFDQSQRILRKVTADGRHRKMKIRLKQNHIHDLIYDSIGIIRCSAYEQQIDQRKYTAFNGVTESIRDAVVHKMMRISHLPKKKHIKTKPTIHITWPDGYHPNSHTASAAHRIPVSVRFISAAQKVFNVFLLH